MSSSSSTVILIEPTLFLAISFKATAGKDVKIEACDTHHGILLCVDDRFKGGQRIPDYIVCKPATKQYRIIPNPKTRYFTLATGLMVIQSNPFRYKIVRVSQPNGTREKEDEGGFLQSLLRGDGSLELVSYEGKLGVICSNSRQGYDLWVMSNSFGNSWVNVKDVKITGLEDEIAKPLWFPSNDVVSVNGFCRLGLCNMNNNKSSYLRMTQHLLPHYILRDSCFPFYSNYERVCLNEDRVGRSNKCKQSKAKFHVLLPDG
ncbi:unnamed protein product [Microthlaspi erraticum]|uniref:Uncharacterized protein n=1 Tax=Microthlaspi erraticum TaxID=1685480 RepID=A0A6D2IKZ8_9BRAS|nr:unnamed protein product [Microthlaspi erraticum]